MIKRWLFYLAALIGLGAYWVYYPSWLSRYLFLLMLCLPAFSLGISLIPILLTKPTLQCPNAVPMGTETWAQITTKNKFPQPHYGSKLYISHNFSDLSQSFTDGDDLPTEHCGQLLLQCRRLWIYDYLGLFRLPIPRPSQRSILVRPTPIPAQLTADLQQNLSHGWKPKPGGGFAENHELRLYRPGDGLNQIHWKLTAKTGKLMIREAMVPKYGRILITLHISGTPQTLDRKLGRLLWLGNYILQQGMSFQICATAGSGKILLAVTNETTLENAMDQLLCLPLAQEDISDDQSSASTWRFHIGGEPDAQ